MLTVTDAAAVYLNGRLDPAFNPDVVTLRYDEGADYVLMPYPRTLLPLGPDDVLRLTAEAQDALRDARARAA